MSLVLGSFCACLRDVSFLTTEAAAHNFAIGPQATKLLVLFHRWIFGRKWTERTRLQVFDTSYAQGSFLFEPLQSNSGFLVNKYCLLIS